MELLRNGLPRVVITGLGVSTSLGNLKALWESLKNGQSGITRIETIDVEHLAVKIGGEIRDFSASDYIEYKDLRRMGRASQFAVVTAMQAIEDAGFSKEEIIAYGERVGVSMGTSLGSHEMSEQTTFKYRSSGYMKPNPLALVNSLPNMPAHYVSRYLGALGPLMTPATACAAGTQAIGEGYNFVRYGKADIVIAGGVEAILQDYIIAGFTAMTALATEYNDSPEKASRPFDLNRSGFVFSEGCGVVVLEGLSSAIKRGARIYAEVLGHASSSDAYHVAAVDPEGMGASRAMKWALEDACINADTIQYINAHGTSTKTNDAIETKAIKRTFGNHAYELMISSTKSMLGHALAGSGAIEAVICSLSLKNNTIAPTINLDNPDPECDLDYTPNSARHVPDMKRVMSNSFGLGGQNASLILGIV